MPKALFRLTFCMHTGWSFLQAATAFLCKTTTLKEFSDGTLLWQTNLQSRTNLQGPGHVVSAAPGPETAESHVLKLPRRPTRPWAIQRHGQGSLCLLSSSLRPGCQAAERVGSMELEKESHDSTTLQCGYWPGRLGLWSLQGCLWPCFGLVIHPNGLEIMANRNNNSQLNKTSMNRNNNWGWEGIWPLGI